MPRLPPPTTCVLSEEPIPWVDNDLDEDEIENDTHMRPGDLVITIQRVIENPEHQAQLKAQADAVKKAKADARKAAKSDPNANAESVAFLTEQLVAQAEAAHPITAAPFAVDELTEYVSREYAGMLGLLCPAFAERYGVQAGMKLVEGAE